MFVIQWSWFLSTSIHNVYESWIKDQIMNLCITEFVLRPNIKCLFGSIQLCIKVYFINQHWPLLLAWFNYLCISIK